ncbi:MAG: tetratricopeptide repeat protein [Rhodanobacter sp.]
MIREAYKDLYQAVMREAGIAIEGMALDQFTVHLHTVTSDDVAHTTELNELGRRLFFAGAYELAMACYELAARDVRAIGAEANLGRCEVRLGRPHDAEKRARSLLERAPGTMPGWHLLGETLSEQERHAEAAEAFQQAVSIAPHDGVLHSQLAHAYERASEFESALRAYERALALSPDSINILAAVLAIKRRLCDWRELDTLSAKLKAHVASGRGEVSPIDFLCEGATAALEFACAQANASKLPVKTSEEFSSWNAVPSSTDKLRVGFVSYGFGPHPTAILTSALFEQLRSSAIETHLFATSHESGGIARRRLAAAAHNFHEVADLSPAQVADKVRALGIEILIDLDGYSRARKPEIFGYRAAPIQVNWLGYPGTTGAGFMDYVIADRFVLPEALYPHFSERVAYLPRCYQSTDTTRFVGNPPSREACGLPTDGAVVYACFNASFKLNPRSVARMLRILKAIPGSVLWLLKGPGQASDRLRRAAENGGVDPSRLVFMDKLSHSDYLARYRHADLFLDTEYYNAHTTASDALWAGCLVLTRPGETFAGRVAGSLNHHLGMDEMNATDDKAFIAQAIRYGGDVTYRAAMRDKLARQIKQSGLFDISAFATDFTALLMRMAMHHRVGGTPDNFSNT